MPLHGSIPGALVPTKEKFYDSPFCSGGAAAAALGGFHGCDVNTDDHLAYINCCLPEDYHALQEIELVFIALATETPMTMVVITNYCSNGQAYSTHNESVIKSINTTLNQLTELDLTDCVDVAALAAGDYIGVQVWRETGKNTDALIMGVRIKYV